MCSREGVFYLLHGNVSGWPRLGDDSAVHSSALAVTMHGLTMYVGSQSERRPDSS